MTYERWENLISTIKDKFVVTKEGKEDLDPGPGQVHFIECNTTLGEIKLQLTVRPRVLEKKTYYSKRVGSSTTVEYKYDPEAHTFNLQAFRREPGTGEWSEIKAESIAASL